MGRTFINMINYEFDGWPYFISAPISFLAQFLGVSPGGIVLGIFGLLGLFSIYFFEGKNS